MTTMSTKKIDSTTLESQNTNFRCLEACTSAFHLTPFLRREPCGGLCKPPSIYGISGVRSPSRLPTPLVPFFHRVTVRSPVSRHTFLISTEKKFRRCLNHGRPPPSPMQTMFHSLKIRAATRKSSLSNAGIRRNLATCQLTRPSACGAFSRHPSCTSA